MAEKPTIVEFFNGKSVFVTGATGFLGKLLLEKLLRCCPGIDTIYILMRERRNKSISERLQDMKDTPLFDVLKTQCPNALDKLKPVSGNIMELGLGLSEEDRSMLEETVSVVFHLAASVKFNDTLKKSTIINLRGTRETLNLAVNMKNLKVFLHVSTAYCNLEQKVVEEVMYPINIRSEDIIDTLEKIDDKTLRILTPKILGEHFPNTYTFGKRLAEQLVDDFKELIPVVIVRPTITVSTKKEPFPGWVDNFNGPIGLFIAGTRGIVRVSYANPDVMADYVPADLVTNGIIMSAWKKAIDSWLKDTSVYQLSAFNVTRISMATILEVGRDRMEEFPSKKMIYYPSAFVTKNYLFFYISMIFLHIVPALVIDLVLKISGRKPMILDIHRRIYVAITAVAYFTLNEWDFLNDKAMMLETCLSDSDFKVFRYGKEHLDVVTYLRNWLIGANKYLLKEEEESVEAARRHFARLKLIHKIVKTVSTLLCIWCVFSLAQFILNSFL